MVKNLNKWNKNQHIFTTFRNQLGGCVGWGVWWLGGVVAGGCGGWKVWWLESVVAGGCGGKPLLIKREGHQRRRDDCPQNLRRFNLVT